MINVKKRDGKIVEFDIQKIKDAIEKAFLALDKKYTPLIERKLKKYFNEFSKKE